MLMEEEKKRKDAEVLESACSRRSQVSEIGELGYNSTTTDLEMITRGPMKDRSLIDPLILPQKQYEVDDARGCDDIRVSSSTFEFQKAEQAPQRIPLAPFSKPLPSKWHDAQKWISSPKSNRPQTVPTQVGEGGRKAIDFTFGSRQSSTNVVAVLDQRLPCFEDPDTKRVNSSLIKNVHLSQHDPSTSIQIATAFVPHSSTASSVSMRDMATEMSPIDSQEPSRIGTPVTVTSPICSPTSSRPSGRERADITAETLDHGHLDQNWKELSKKETQMRRRKEIMVLGKQLDKMNIAALASPEEEGKDASTSVNNVMAELPHKSEIEARADAWEETEIAKYMARFEREEMKIQAWEEHEKAKTEAEMRKIEVEVERIRARAQDRLIKNLADARHKAEEKQAAAESRRNKQAAKIEQRAEFIRNTSRIPFKFCFWNCCC
ncbi:hypothetical protein Nepgr_008562 [Nepenthes gracilis]|uniref:Remorin C-terminal domain-containing protein n=1 Tax=Nepenthes gracilis TaxID=150966 RepID=A0AAD3S9R4_NEPGR|nr:hypothetical protein Nepgr_008562 [Nepenthes gracilis]